MSDTNIDDTMNDELNKNNRQPDGWAKRKLKGKAKKHARNVAKKAKDKMATTLFKPVGMGIFSSVISIAVIIFMLIGIVSFIITMPGLVKEGIMAKVAEAIDWVNTSLFGSDYFLEKLASDQDKTAQKAVLKYLDDMGIDPVGFGFAPFYRRITDEKTGEETGEVDYDTGIMPEYYDSDGFFGAKKYQDQLKEKTITEDLIFKYIVSNERTYLIHDNAKIPNIFKSIKEIFSDDNYYLTGMIRAKISGANFLEELNDSTISVNREEKTMEITSKDWSELTSNKFKYNLEGWTGRYGMPLEFLLALHIATMSPDLTEELIENKNLQTEVNVLLEKDEDYNIDYKITYKDKELPIKRGKLDAEQDLGKDFIDKYINKQDCSVNIPEEEIETVKQKMSINSLYGLITKLRNDFSPGIETEIPAQSTKELKTALLGSERFGVVRKICTSNYDNNFGAVKWPTYIGTASVNNGQYNVNYPDYLIIDESRPKVKNNNDGRSITYDSDYILNISNTSEHSNYEGDENVLETSIIHGFGYYITGQYQNELKDKNVQLAMTSALSQLDAYLYANGIEYISDVKFTEYDISQGQIQGLSMDGETHLYITQKWIDFCNEGIDSKTDDEITKELLEIQKDIEDCFEILDKKTERIQLIVDNIFKAVGYDDIQLNIEDINKIYTLLSGQQDTVEFVFPRIKNVIKHWYKDVVFEEGTYSSYQKTTDEINVDYPMDSEDVKVTAVLTGTKYNQNVQPYVVKGDIITVDGKMAENPKIGDKVTDLDGNDIKDYKLGDGYRASKKIFTQGRYYTFDGTPDTSKSIYYAKEIEKLSNGEAAQVLVKGGRIIAFSKVTLTDKEISDAQGGTWEVKRAEKRENEDLGDTYKEENGWRAGLKEASVSASTGENVNRYLIYIDKQLKYLSPADHTFEETKESTERINSLLNFMGVVTVRKEISFDNTVNGGDVTSLTAFSILEGMKTEDAQLIYRDLKEFLIELGYYTKAEFEQLSTNVLTWFIPEYMPENPENWQQNKTEDALLYGAIIYPQEIDDNTGKETDEGTDEKTDKTAEMGFTEDLEIVAPGNCRIIECKDNSITLEFDGTSQPEISIVDGYTMIISGGIKVSNSDVITVLNEDATAEVEMTIQEAIEGKNIVRVGTKIAFTGTEKIQVILKNNLGGYLPNVQDYMAPNKMNNGNIEQSNWHYFYYIPYESGGVANPNNGPGSAVTYTTKDGQEWAVGICQWTIKGKMDNIKPLLVWLYQQDRTLCAELGGFQSWTTGQITSNYSQIQQAFSSINNRDTEKFLSLQMQYALEEKKNTISRQGLDWVFDSNRNGVVAGTLMSLINWRPSWPYNQVINDNMSDEEIVKTLMAYAYYRSPEETTDSSILASWLGRWESQAKFAVDVINGKFVDVENFVKNGASGEAASYGGGKNKGYLDSTLRKNGW